MLHCLLLPSANDAAMALAEATSGSAEAFQVALDQEATHLGFADAPVLRDPAGLDDHFSVGGGNLLSARDLAIAGRALLADDILAPIVATREYRFTGGDGVFHKIVNHDKLLSLYPGSIGVKTGYTKKAGNTIVAAAQRDGRTLIVVVLGGVGSYSTYGTVTALLDQGFATPAAAEPADADRLPPVPDMPEARLATAEAATAAAAPSTSTGSGPPGLAGEAASQATATRTDSQAMSGASGMSVGGLFLGLGLALTVVVSLRLRARVRVRRRHGRG